MNMNITTAEDDDDAYLERILSGDYTISTTSTPRMMPDRAPVGKMNAESVKIVNITSLAVVDMDVSSLDHMSNPNNHDDDGCSSISAAAAAAAAAEETELSSKCSSITGTSTCTGSPRKKLSSVAIQMATLQASFAERNAEEMKQIVDWYDSTTKQDSEKDAQLSKKGGTGMRTMIMTQSRSLPDNPMACWDDDDEEEEEVEENEENERRTPRRTNRKRNSDSDEGWEYNSGNTYTPLKRTSGGSGAGTTGPRFGNGVDDGDDASTVDGDDDGDGLPDLTTSPSTVMMAESPMSSHGDENNNHYNHSTSKFSSNNSSSRVAQEQDEVVKHLLESTRYMADIVLEYEQSSSASDRERTDGARNHNATTITRRRRRPPRTSFESDPSEMRPDRKVTSSSTFQRQKRKRTRNKRIGGMVVGVALLFLIWMTFFRGTNIVPPSSSAASRAKNMIVGEGDKEIPESTIPVVQELLPPSIGQECQDDVPVNEELDDDVASTSTSTHQCYEGGHILGNRQKQHV